MSRPTCKCVNQMENVVGLNFEVDTKNDVKRVTILEADLISGATFSTLEILYTNQKKKEAKKKVLVVHNFCPFCGKRYK